MKKVLSVITCSILAACSCSENQWEEVDVVTYEEPTYEEKVVVDPEPAEVLPAKVVVEQEPVYVPAPAPAPQPVYNCPCSVQPCYQPVCYQACPCAQPAPQPVPQPKVTTTKKIITTTTTIEEPCEKPVCEPVVTTHEEVLPAEVSYNNFGRPVQEPNVYPEVVVDRAPYTANVVSAPKVDGSIAAKYSPEAYDVVATRATNRMLQDTSATYGNGQHQTVFLRDTKLLSSDLPYGSHRLKSTTKDIINGSKVYDVVNNSNDANFIVDSSADWYVANNAAPALQYKLAMFDRSGRKINEWVEIIRQVQE